MMKFVSFDHIIAITVVLELPPGDYLLTVTVCITGNNPLSIDAFSFRNIVRSLNECQNLRIPGNY